MTYPDLKIVHRSFLKTQLHLPYISGYLAFREVEPLLQLLNELKSDNPSIYPQVVLVDGNGLLHPRQFGIACHLGVSASVPTIGVAKKFMHIPDELENMSEIKEKSKRMLQKKGDHFILQGKTTHTVYGAVLRSSNNASNPIFVSQGHLISLETAIHITLESSSLYRIPDPIRSADLESRAYIREHYCISK
ncbi:endonuclease V [Pilobolus umbonatus]|nr:endonuclease V [Pilobolus umbonatus]